MPFLSPVRWEPGILEMRGASVSHSSPLVPRAVGSPQHRPASHQAIGLRLGTNMGFNKGKGLMQFLFVTVTYK